MTIILPATIISARQLGPFVRFVGTGLARYSGFFSGSDQSATLKSYMTMRDSAAATRRVSEDASLTLRVCAAESCTLI
jgi:hypothetical protein